MKNREVLKSYFQRGKYPTEQQYAELIDSLRHLLDPINVSDVIGLQRALNGKAGVEVTETLNDILERIDNGELGGMTPEQLQTLEDLAETVSNLTTKDCGYFPTVADLQTAVPSPVEGQSATVGPNFEIYACITAGTWTATGEKTRITSETVSSLPANPDAHTIYILPGQDSWTENVYSNNSWLVLATHSGALSIDEAPTEGSVNPVQSGGVYDAIEAAASGAGASVSIDKNSDASDSYTLIFLQNVEKYILQLTLQDSNENVFANSNVTINGVEYTTSASGIVSIELFSGSRTLVISIEGYETQSISVNMDGNKSMTLTFNEYVSPNTIILTNAVNSDIPSKYVNAPLINLMVSALSGLEYSNDPVLLDESGNPAKTITKQQAEYFTGDLYFYGKSGSTSVTSLAQLVFFSNASLVYRAFMGMSSVVGDFIFKGYIKSLGVAFHQTQLSKIDLSEVKSYSDPLVVDISGAPAEITTFPTGFVILSTAMDGFGYGSAPVNFDAPKLGIHSSCHSMVNFFRAATKTETIKMGDWYLSGITSTGAAFYNCSKLRTIEATFHADLDIDISLSPCPLTAESVENILGALKPYPKDSGTHTITFSATAKANYNAVHEIVDTTYTSALQEAVASLGWTLA